MSNPKGCELFVRESIKLLSLLCPNQGGATSILHSSRPFRYSLLLTIPGIVAYIPSITLPFFLCLMRDRHTHPFHWRTATVSCRIISFFERHQIEQWLFNNQHHGAAAAHPLPERYDLRPSPRAEPSRNGHLRNPQSQSTSIPLYVQLLTLNPLPPSTESRLTPQFHLAFFCQTSHRAPSQDMGAQSS